MTNNYYQKRKEKLQKEARERYQNISGKKKAKIANILVSNREIFLKKKKKRSVNERYKTLYTHPLEEFYIVNNINLF